jgi:DNA-binding MarR family transcriptional regulator
LATRSRKSIKPRITPRNQYVPYLLGRVSKSSASAASVLYRQWLGVGINNARVVIALARESGLTATQLTTETGLDKAVISRSLNLLRAKKMIRFDDVTRRRRKAELLPPGEELSRRISRVMTDRERLLLKGFSTKEKAALINYLQRMLVNVPAANAYRPPTFNAPRPAGRRTGSRSPR